VAGDLVGIGALRKVNKILSKLTRDKRHTYKGALRVTDKKGQSSIHERPSGCSRESLGNAGEHP
jgi:alkylated DNA nucleotide flippase Atl1